MSDKFHHHPLLQVVANEDVRFLLDKDRKYGASWKKSGGRSAWFMMVRKMDRLMEMMEPEPWPESFSIEDLRELAYNGEDKNAISVGSPEAAFTLSLALAHDMFAKIEDAPGGEDGTVLAEFRDLRRYLLLAEAEMMARGVVARPSATLPPLDERVPDELDEIMTHVQELVECLPDLLGVRHSKERRAILALQGLLFRGRALDVSDEPWVVHPAKLSDLPRKIANILYRRWAPDSAILETNLSEPEHFEITMMVEQPTLVAEALTCYEKIGDFWVLRVGLSPSDRRSLWPVLATECNSKEHADLENWKRQLYVWYEVETKFKIAESARAWTEGGQ